MSDRLRVLRLPALCALAVIAGVAEPWPARVAVPAAGGGVPPGVATLPLFTTFGWVSPPLWETTARRYAELGKGGMNVTVLAFRDTGGVADNHARLELCRPLGIRCLLYDQRLERVDPNRPETFVWVDSVVAEYRDDPAFLGYYLGDEPQPEHFGLIDTLAMLLRERDPVHPSWNNLIGRGGFATRDAWLAYTRLYADRLEPSVLCNDQYDFLNGWDGLSLVENVAGLSEVARECGLPFWGIIQLVGHGFFRQVTPGELRWQVSQWLSFGARGIGLFTYWTPPPDPEYNWQEAMIGWDGTRTAMFDTVATLLPYARVLGETLATHTWLTTRHAGFLPRGGAPFAPDSLLAAVSGRAALGLFVDARRAPSLFVGNSDSLAPRTIGLELTSPRRAWQLDGDRVWHPLGGGGPVSHVALPLLPGGFALVRFDGAFGGPLGVGDAGPRPPGLAVSPNPGRLEVRFDAVVDGPATLEILDLAGRRAWSRRLDASGGRRWRGEREGGGRAAPGVYVARLSDARGVTTRSFVWLGAGGR